MRKFIIPFLLLVFALVPAYSATQKACISCAFYTSQTSFCTTNLNSVPSQTTAPCNTVIANGTNLDLYAHYFFTFGTLTASAQASSAPVNLFHYYLNEDSSYGEGLFTSTGSSASAGAPNQTYSINCSIYAIPGATTAFKGGCGNVPLQPMNYEVMVNNATNVSGTGAFASSGNVGYILTSNYTISQIEFDRLLAMVGTKEFAALGVVHR